MLNADRRPPLRTWLRPAVQVAVVVGLVIETARLRRRAAALRVLTGDAAARAPADDRTDGENGYCLLKLAGVRIDDATVAAARAHARARGLAAVDLVPGDLPVVQALDLLRDVDPAVYGRDPAAYGRGACYAALVDSALLRAAGLRPDRCARTPSDLAEAIVAVKRCAPTRVDLVVAADLQSDARATGESARIVVAPSGPWASFSLNARVAWTGTVLASAALGGVWAPVVVAAWSSQPLAVFAGPHGLKPADRWSRAALRVLEEPRHVLAMLRAARRIRAAQAERVRLLRPAYQEELAAGTARLFEPARTDCPWCGSMDLCLRLRTSDLLQHKPGQFTLDRCEACGHIFQNPRLTTEGLNFYYRDFYDGLGELWMDAGFGSATDAYRSRAAALKGLAAPGSWLDVGTGYGHFCRLARELWPQTTFDGLDMGSGIELAELRGWIRTGFRGMFVDVAPDIGDTYDVVSMFHYLEHTPEPQRQLEAARHVLRPGGHLVIDVPDPEARWGALLGRWWVAWLQPQHLHLISAGNLRQRLEDIGFDVVLEQHSEAHLSSDLVVAAALSIARAAPALDVPWLAQPPRPIPGPVRGGAVAAALPVILAAAWIDKVIAPHAWRLGLTNSYRIVARKV